MSCSENSLLKGIKDKQAQLDSLLEGGKAQLASMSSKLNELKADLESFKPELPNIGGLQKELLGLAALTTPEGLAAKIAELNEKYGAKVPNLSSLISSLGLDSFPPSISISDICDQIPNVEEKPDGTIKEEPKESKPAEEKPPEPTPEKKTAPVEPIDLDKYELNKDLLNRTHSIAKELLAIQLGGSKKVFVRKKNNQTLYDLTVPELVAELAETGGSTFDDFKIYDYTYADLQKRREKFLKKKNAEGKWDFVAEGRIFAREYDLAKAYSASVGNPLANAESFSIAATQSVERRKEKLKTS